MASQPLSSPLDSVQSSMAAPMLAEGLYLQLLLDHSLPALLPAPHLVEILTVAIGQIVPIFHLPPWVMGVYNWRGEVLWMVDLNHLLGFSPWYEQPNYGAKHTVVVLRGMNESNEKAMVGLVVNQIEDMVECTADRLHLLSEFDPSSDPLSNFLSNLQLDSLSANLHHFFWGYWQSETSPRYWLLNSAAILQSLSEPFS
ncbi:chemotaxis protein CheW [Leptolyngbya sp. FACHB-711]|uniref:chemotaxis protein CheW n=1 Tax=unclassified Leptolyngbya TaxID=2650499 RepID=UPI0016858B29|nr:chemotaxis protein CheW [Leptolyngbya sp. FACHB-711]MBD1848971.1 chemotaxis protein CheW [Cyanobacteria bacterium FACHB-502]MBD2026602.1 chemotaxis protein CheW [Leptolyngbya sp. FACHB-711]